MSELEREKFEKWARSIVADKPLDFSPCLNTSCSLGFHYLDKTTAWTFSAWLARSEAGSPAPAPTYVGVDFGRGKDATGYHCSVCGDSLKPCEHWIKFEAAPAPTEEK